MAIETQETSEWTMNKKKQAWGSGDQGIITGQNLDAEKKFYAAFTFQECIEGQYWEDIFSHFSKIADKKNPVLDLCCGDGSWDMVLTLRGFSTVGADVSKDMLATRKALFKKYKKKAVSVKGDCTHLPLKDGSFKTITIISGLHHFPNKDPIIKEVARVGSKDAVFFAWEPNLFNPLIWFDYWYKLRVKKDGSYSENEYPINPLKLKKILQNHFQDVCVYAVRLFPNKRWIDPADRLASKIPILNLFGAIIVVVAKNPIKWGRSLPLRNPSLFPRKPKRLEAPPLLRWPQANIKRSY